MALGLDTSPFTVTTVGQGAPEADIGAVLRRRAQATPHQVAFRFLVDGEDEAIEWTYSQLDRYADRVASELKSQLAPGARVLLVLEPGLKYIAALFGIFKAGATAVPSFPPTGSRAVSRLASICSDCRAQLIIAEPGLRNSVERINTALSSGGHVPEWMFIDDAYFSGAAAPGAAGEPVVAAAQAASHADVPALLQYTSGSTGNPKGVVLSHANLMSNSRVLDDRLGPGQAHVGFTWLPPYHDMGLMGALLLSVYSGFTLVVMTPAHFVQRPLRWLQGLSDHKVTTSVGPNFALDLCVDSISDDEIAQLDLSHLKLLFCGAEPVRQATLDRFSEKFKPTGFSPAAFVPCYGLAEATLFISGKPDPAVPALSLSLDKAALEAGTALPAATQGQAAVVASCGTVALGHTVAIVDPDTRERLADNAVGEIWFKGASVALGYFNQAPASADVFKASIAGAPHDGPYLRTGDLGFMRDGELYVTGRIKDVIIFAGRNLYPQDIEATVQACHGAVRTNGVAAFSVTRDNAEQLVIVAEIQRTARLSANGLKEVAAAITSAVTQSHGVAPHAVHLAPVSTIPLTTSGKVRRSACRDAFNDSQLAHARARAIEPAAADSALAAA